MSRISACLIALLLASMPLSFAESESLISQDLITADKVNYKTITVEQSDFAPTFTAAGEESYPRTYSLSLNESGAWFESYTVSRGDEVKKGDVLATFTMDTDAVELATLRLQLENTQAALDKRMEDEEEAELERQRSLLAVSDPYERRMILLQSERAELVNEQYKINQQRTIAQIQERIDEIVALQDGYEIVSPVDGIVEKLEPKREGEAVHEGEILIEVYSTDEMLLCVDNSGGLFRYGMEVSVEVGPNKDRTTLKGRVVGADTLIPIAERTNMAYIQLENAEGLDMHRPVITAPVVSLKNVTLLNHSVLDLYGGEYFVTIVSDGVPVKKFITCASYNLNGKVWVLQGLEPGDEIIID